ncbi:MAG TPA: hypothetical protein VNZ45_01000, partial [Bacteroidia bacterium]|nr:hypothetical protein [Bacteroidia bacterium]
MTKTTPRLILLLTIVLCVLQGNAQVSVILYPSPAKQFFIDDLWKTTLINTSTSSNHVIIQCQIKTGNSQDVLTITTQAVTLSPGANSLNATESETAKWNYGSAGAAAILKSTGKLPYGQYTLCIMITTLTGKPLGSNCEELDIQPMLPPELASPRNEEVLTMQYPVL